MNITPPKMPPLPARIAKLPKNERGYPVPFFVAWVGGVPDFRMVRPETIQKAVRERLCWICGEPLGSQGSFVLGPMCCVNRTNSEPPSHRQCAEFAVQACPFMLNPGMVRREDAMTDAHKMNVPGVMIERNPGVMAIWSTKTWEQFPDGLGRRLFRIGKMSHISWWRQGREARTAEIEESINSGVPFLKEVCTTSEEIAALLREVDVTSRMVRETSTP